MRKVPAGIDVEDVRRRFSPAAQSFILGVDMVVLGNDLDSESSSASHASSSQPRPNINTAAVEELRGTRGIDTRMADRIVWCRPFQDWREVFHVEGIDKEQIDNLKKNFDLIATTEVVHFSQANLVNHHLQRGGRRDLADAFDWNAQRTRRLMMVPLRNRDDDHELRDWFKVLEVSCDDTDSKFVVAGSSCSEFRCRVDCEFLSMAWMAKET